ncbi:MAG: DegT/DnrJ/EryC1/StrS aminotransferase family protein [Flavobacteriales bacterium]|nr:DegT/DnrJ/EryC1/StrS aminotransferase family protein [Flavobacteriales bacterium]
MIPFSPPRIDEESIAEVVDTLRSGWITTGPKTKELERQISKYCGTQRSLCLNSWTNAAELFLRWWGIGEGDEVIIPAYTYCATANIVRHLGAEVVMVDVGEDFLMDIEALRSSITKKTKVIMPVDIGGNLCDYDSIRRMVMEDRIVGLFHPASDVQENLGRILILADAAHSFGASQAGFMSGKLADVTVFSFHAVKNLTTAEGGAITFNLPNSFHLESIYKDLNTLSLHGQNKDALAKSQSAGWKYDVLSPGYKCNMTDIHASLGLVEIKRYQENLDRRRSIHERYTEAFANHEWFQAPKGAEENSTPSWHLYMLRIKGISETQRDNVITEIEARGVSVNVHFIPLPMLTVYRSIGFDINDFPVAYDNYSRVITLPIYYQLNDQEVEVVISAVIDSVSQVLDA